MKRASVLLLVLAAVGPSWLHAQAYDDAPPPAEKSRLFFGFSLFQASPRGELDGKYVFGDPTYAFYLPRLDPAAGLYLQGGRILKSGLWSVAYFQSGHAAGFHGLRRTAAIRGLEVEGRGFLIRQKPVRPYLQAGFSVSWLTVKDGCFKNEKPCDALYMGLGAKAGAGLTVRIVPQIVLTGGAYYRYLALLYVRGGGASRDVANFYVDRFGPRRRSFIRVPSAGWEIGLLFTL